MENISTQWSFTSALLIVAHPDDETLWAGGLVRLHPETEWTIVVLCRGNDRDRAPRFEKVLQKLGASGAMGDLDDSPEQTPLSPEVVRQAIRSLVGEKCYEVILTHSEDGEYTRHRRHEEIGKAVLALWDCGELHSQHVWAFAYGDSGRGRRVRTLPKADVQITLSQDIWSWKRAMITEVYGFALDSFESNAALADEAFWIRRSLGVSKGTA
jgi:LmbE family N-acetylglucosaminyl deacetylase